MTTSTIELRAGALRLALRPDLGGSIAGLWHGDEPVLRSTEPGALQSSRVAACYPLAPYSNRLGNRHFHWQGAAYTTAQNFDDNPHSVHGMAWQRPWHVADTTAHTAGEVTLRLLHTPDADWPFAFALQQRFVLTASALEVHLVFTNTAAQPQPVGLGWHPYFHKRPQSHLQIALTERWESDASGLPTHKVAQPDIDAPVAQLSFDNCFEGWHGPARISDDLLAMQLTSSLPDLVIFTPDTKPYYCVEPVSHVSNAIQMTDPAAHGLQTVAPGASCAGWMKLEISAL